MAHLLITNIKKLVQVEDKPKKWKAGKEMADVTSIDNAWLLLENDRIKDFGSMSKLSTSNSAKGLPTGELKTSNMRELDASGRMVFPSFCDSHTHLVYPASREIEYVDKIKGLSYEEIAKRGGGILNSAKRMKETTVAELVDSALQRLEEIASYGTGVVEIKSGYGLDTDEELKMLYAIRKLKELSPLTIKSTFLGAHSIPAEYR